MTALARACSPSGLPRRSLYGNVMSGTIIVGILISVAPFFFPVVMQVLGLLTGLIQAYIFAVLAMVYIASGARSSRSPSSGAGASPANQTGHSQTRKEP